MSTSSTKRTYRLVNDFGAIVRMTERNYRRYITASLKALRAKKDAPVSSEYGTEIGQLAFTATDARLTDYEWALDALTPSNTK